MSRYQPKPMGCAPNVAVISFWYGQHVLSYQDVTRWTSRAKAAGATCLELRVAITDRDDAPLEEARRTETFTRNPMVVSFDPQLRGRIATYYARWCGRKNEFGPWSLPVSMTIAA
jgi:hypothetical protein